MFLHKILPVAPPLWLAADELEMPPANLGKILLYALHKSASAFASKSFKSAQFAVELCCILCRSSSRLVSA